MNKMSEDKIIELNKSIAMFMGIEEYRIIDEFLVDKNGGCTRWKDGVFYYISKFLNYHYDWRELMSVVEKIDKLKYTIHKTSEYFNRVNPTNIKYVNNTIMVTTDIKGVWNDIVNFIEWFNENKQK